MDEVGVLAGARKQNAPGVNRGRLMIPAGGPGQNVAGLSSALSHLSYTGISRWWGSNLRPLATRPFRTPLRSENLRPVSLSEAPVPEGGAGFPPHAQDEL